MKKLLFHFLNIIFILLYIFPGSILGFFIYNDLNKQPQLTPNFIVSSNHLWSFLLLSLLGMLIYKKNKNRIILYLFSISILLELFHLVVPNRSFQFSDLFGNILGILLSLIIINLINFWKKNEFI